MLSLKPTFAALFALFVCALLMGGGRTGKAIHPYDGGSGGSRSHGILVGDTIYVSGMCGEDASGKIPSSFEAEVLQTFDNVGAVLRSAGMSPSDVVSVQVYLTDLTNLPLFDRVYTNYFKAPGPARTTVIVAKLVRGGNIEFAATARK